MDRDGEHSLALDAALGYVFSNSTLEAQALSTGLRVRGRAQAAQGTAGDLGRQQQLWTLQSSCPQEPQPVSLPLAP